MKATLSIDRIMLRIRDNKLPAPEGFKWVHLPTGVFTKNGEWIKNTDVVLCYERSNPLLGVSPEWIPWETQEELQDHMDEVLGMKNKTRTGKMWLEKKLLKQALAELLKHVQVHKAKDYPKTCGACGTPSAQCDTNCMTAGHMAEHDAAIRRAQALLGVRNG